MMDDEQKKYGAKGVLDNPVFQLFYKEAYEVQLKALELGDPNNPEALTDANKALRTLRSFKRKLEDAANKGES